MRGQLVFEQKQAGRSFNLAWKRGCIMCASFLNFDSAYLEILLVVLVVSLLLWGSMVVLTFTF